ncbi:uncharacterized protein LOC128202861 [Mya arenaria]|uniref:uncharacterized protein LOC128202861 n=1 Tax=Mya arenaria TaxID=6604 RepID=UPI0022E7EFC2|nr:uncharacterized protein LOC128202861 [Mya arenaria]
MRKVAIIVLFQLLDIAASQTSYGRQFFLGFPRNSDVGQSHQISIDIVTRVKAQTVSLTIQSPFQHGLNANKTLKFTSQKTFSLSDGYELHFTERDRRGVYVEANHDVAVFVTNVQGDNSGDTYAAIPVQGLGNKYVVAAYEHFDFSYPSEFLIVATQDNTDVHMSFPNGSRFTLDLQKYDVYQESSPRGDLSGTVITSNNNFSLFGGATCGELKNDNGPFNGCDFMVDQIPPLNGNNRNIEVIIPEIFHQNYVYRIYSGNVTSQICHRNKTRGQAECLQSSDFNHNMYESTMTNGTSAVYCKSADFFVALYKDQQGFMMIIPSIDQYLTSYRFLIPSIYSSGQNHYIAVIVPTAEKAGIMINGQPDSPIASTLVVSPFENYTVVTYRVSNLHVNDVTHSAGNVKFGLFCYGYKDRSPASAYGFAIGFAFGM